MRVTSRVDAHLVADDAEPLGALVIRVWRAPEPGSPLVARLMGRHDTRGEETTIYAAGIAEILAQTREWLLRYEAATDRA